MGRHQPALLGGLFIGVLSSLPVINIANCCCLWVIGGGMLVVYLQQQNTPEPVETADAVLGGLIAGAIGAVIVILGQWAFAAALGSMGWQDQLRSAIESEADLPPEVRELIISITSNSGSMALLGMVITLPIYAVFSMLGSLLGLAIFRKKLPPATQG
jgi:hypothetical protein